ncbi:MAG TPA: helix-turn-helix domain-containing protein [Solirubrobacteraceae bacterium]
MPPDEPGARTAATHSLTLDRGLRALEVLAANRAGLSISELAAALDTHRAAVYRLLGPLGDHHLVRRDGDGRFTLAPGLIELAAAVQPRLHDVAEPVLRTLADRFGATTALTVRDGDGAVVSLVVAPRDARMHLTYRTGMRHLLTQGAPGHALLAAAPARAGEPADVAATRARGYALTAGELLPGATGVAAAIAAPGGRSEAAISVVWITGIDPEAAGAAVMTSATDIAAALRC